MTPAQDREARVSLSLTLAELGQLLDLDRRAVSRLEAPASAATHRAPPLWVVRLLNAYMAGHRPADFQRTRSVASESETTD